MSTTVDRLVRFRAMDEADARARIGRQVTREQRLAAADRVIDNSGDRESLIACEVIAMIGMCLVPSAAFSRRVASQPSITGRLMSMRIKSGASEVAMAIP